MSRRNKGTGAPRMTQAEVQAEIQQIREDYAAIMENPDKPLLASMTFDFFIDRNGVLRCITAVFPNDGLFLDPLRTLAEQILVGLHQEIVPNMQNVLHHVANLKPDD